MPNDNEMNKEQISWQKSLPEKLFSCNIQLH